MSQSGGITVRRHAISGVFVFLLLGLFALFSIFMVMLGAQQYRTTVSDTTEHSADRVLNSYLLNTLRGSDESDSVYVTTRDGIDMLVAGYSVDGTRYETKIYCHNGMLRELFGSADEPFEPDNGEMICEMKALELSAEGGLLKLRITGADGQSRTLYSSLRCGIAEGA